MPACCPPEFGLTAEGLYFVCTMREQDISDVYWLGLCLALQKPPTTALMRETLVVFLKSYFTTDFPICGFLSFLKRDAEGDPIKIMLRCEETGKYDITGSEFAAVGKPLLMPRAERSKDYKRSCGTIVCALASRLISSIECERAPPPERTSLKRLRRVLEHIAARCTYERSGDKYVHDALRSRLDAWRSAIIPLNATPYDEFAEQYKDAANSTGRRIIETDPETMFLNVKWSSTSDTAGFHFLVGVLREALDGVETRLVSNAAVAMCATAEGCCSTSGECCHEATGGPGEPTLVVFDAGFDIGYGQCFGVHCGEKLILPGEAPHLTILWKFLTLLDAPSAKMIVTACLRPTEIPPTSSLYEISERLLEITV